MAKSMACSMKSKATGGCLPPSIHPPLPPSLLPLARLPLARAVLVLFEGGGETEGCLWAEPGASSSARCHTRPACLDTAQRRERDRHVRCSAAGGKRSRRGGAVLGGGGGRGGSSVTGYGFTRHAGTSGGSLARSSRSGGGCRASSSRITDTATR
jgi:hypothetical protein